MCICISSLFCANVWSFTKINFPDEVGGEMIPFYNNPYNTKAVSDFWQTKEDSVRQFDRPS